MSTIRAISASLWVIGLCTASPSFAQSVEPTAPVGTKTAAPDKPGIQPAAPTTAEPAQGLGEIIVTAQKRAESLNNVGMAITALTGNQLRIQNVTTVNGLAKIEPSLVVSQSKYGAPSYTIRGVGYNDYSIAASPTVSVYVDEVPYSYLVNSKGASLDVERVEILKGPQGTLYGQNATGGAVNFIAAKPTREASAGIEGSYASYDAYSIRGYISGPLTDTLSVRVAADTMQGGGYQHSISRDAHNGDRDLFRARMIAEWRPTDKLKVRLNVNGFADDSEPLAAQATGLAPQKLGPYPNTAIADPALRGRTFPDIVGLTATPRPTNDKQADWYAGQDPTLHEKYWQATLRADYTLAPEATLSYLGSYEHYNQDDLTETSGRTQPSYYEQNATVRATSQEVRLSGKLFDNKLDYVIGGTYSWSRVRENDELYYLGITTAYSTVTLPFLTRLTPGYVAPTTNARITSDNRNNTYAAFGNVEYHLLDNLDIHGGARYTKSKTDYAGCDRAGDPQTALSFEALQIIAKVNPLVPLSAGSCVTFLANGRPGEFHDTLDEHNVAWRAGVDWHPIPKTLLYASVSKGYKSGSFPTLAATSYVQLQPVTQESVLAYEVGAKSQLLDNRVQFEGALFYYDYKNKQLTSNRPDVLGIFGILNALVNIPKSAEKGAEVSLKVLPVRGLTLSAQATYLDSYVRKHFLGYTQFSTAQVDLHGEPFPNTPKWSLLGGAQYDLDLGGDLKAYVGGNVRYQTKSQGAFANDTSEALGFPPLTIKSYTIVDLRAGIETRDGRWYAQVFGNNVTNTYYWTQASRIFDGTVRFAGAPATVGVTIGHKFGM